jgi:hypothetical protein
MAADIPGFLIANHSKIAAGMGSLAMVVYSVLRKNAIKNDKLLEVGLGVGALVNLFFFLLALFIDGYEEMLGDLIVELSVVATAAIIYTLTVVTGGFKSRAGE